MGIRQEWEVFFMEEDFLRVSNKDLFYSAMMLKLDRLVNVEYVFPADDAKLAKELDEVKRSLHKRKLLKESAKGEITLDFALAACATFCARPENCAVVDRDGFYATVYDSGGAYMLLERLSEDESGALWFKDREAVDGYLTRKLASLEGKEEAKADGGA
jgi:hypothetical protein